MTVELALLGLGLVAPLVASWWVQRRRTAARARGGAARYRCSLVVAPGEAPGPYPAVRSRGALLVGDGTLLWHGDDGLRLDLSRTGLLPVRRREPASSAGRRADDVVLACQDGQGTNLHVQGRVDSVLGLWDELRARPLPAAPLPPTVLPPARDHRWAVRPGLALLSSGLLAGVLSALFWTATPVQATVLAAGSVDEYCTVAWTDPRSGADRRNDVDCYEAVGADERYYALAGPLHGELVHADDPLLWAVVSGALVLGSLAWLATGAAGRRRARPARPGAGAAPRAARLAEVAPLTADRSDFASVTAHARARAEAEGWSFDGCEGAPDALPVPRWARTDRGRLVAVLSVPLGAVLGVGTLAVLLGWAAFTGLATTWQPTATVTATVEGEPFELVPFGPVELDVRFRDGEGRPHQAYVVVDAGWTAVDTLPVEYAVARPGHARALRSDATPTVLALAAVAVGAALAFAGWRLRTVLHVRRAEQRAAARPPRELGYVLLHSVDSECVLVLSRSDGFGTPDRAVVLVDDVRGTLPGTGRLTLRGDDAPGSAVLAAWRGRPLALASWLLELDRDELLALVNATDLDDGPDRTAPQPKKTSASA